MFVYKKKINKSITDNTDVNQNLNKNKFIMN